MNNPPKVLTGIDVPYGTPGGSITLFTDLYLARGAPIQADAFMLSGPVNLALPTNLKLFDVQGKADAGVAYSAYAADLADALRTAYAEARPELLHLHHLAFGASPAMIDAFPDVPSIAFVHGTDLLTAQNNPQQRDVLVHIADHADAIIAPTNAMVDRLRCLIPHLDLDKIHRIGWGLPDRFRATARKEPSLQRCLLRLLYAGRLTPEKGFDRFAMACAVVGLPLSVAAPTRQWHETHQRLGLAARGVNYLGWLRRDELWDEFARHDVLAVPSLDLEAFCLTAVEAQAAGLPVVYRAVDGLSDVLGDSAMPADLHDSVALAKAADSLRCGALLNELRDRGRANAAHYKLSVTATAITALGRRVAATVPTAAR